MSSLPARASKATPRVLTYCKKHQKAAIRESRAQLGSTPAMRERHNRWLKANPETNRRNVQAHRERARAAKAEAQAALPYVKAAEAARILGVSNQTISNLLARGRLNRHPSDGGSVFVTKESIECERQRRQGKLDDQAD